MKELKSAIADCIPTVGWTALSPGTEACHKGQEEVLRQIGGAEQRLRAQMDAAVHGLGGGYVEQWLVYFKERSYYSCIQLSHVELSRFCIVNEESCVIPPEKLRRTSTASPVLPYRCIHRMARIRLEVHGMAAWQTRPLRSLRKDLDDGS